MKIEFKLGDLEFQYERPPMPAGRFRALCLLAAAELYAGLLLGFASMCGAFSAVIMAIITLAAPMLYPAFKNDF